MHRRLWRHTNLGIFTYLAASYLGIKKDIHKNEFMGILQKIIETADKKTKKDLAASVKMGEVLNYDKEPSI